MKFAVQTVAWGPSQTNISEIMRCAAACGYQGVELFQDVQSVGGARGVFDSCQDAGISLVGIMSGSFSERVEFVREYSTLLRCSTDDVRAPYICVEEWDDGCRYALNDNIRVCIHPHMFRQIQTEREANAILHGNNSPNLYLLADTAHLTIAGDNVQDVLLKHFGRVVSVRLKDWDPSVGRSYQFYASGFCAFGAGSVPLTSALDVLWKRSFGGWLVVDTGTAVHPYRSIDTSMSWLKQHLPPSLFGK